MVRVQAKQEIGLAAPDSEDSKLLGHPHFGDSIIGPQSGMILQRIPWKRGVTESRLLSGLPRRLENLNPGSFGQLAQEGEEGSYLFLGKGIEFGLCTLEQLEGENRLEGIGVGNLCLDRSVLRAGLCRGLLEPLGSHGSSSLFQEEIPKRLMGDGSRTARIGFPCILPRGFLVGQFLKPLGRELAITIPHFR